MMTKRILWLGWLWLAVEWAVAQVPENDFCENALRLQVGEVIHSIDNTTATISTGQIPEGLPITCIQTFENDLWFDFITTDSYRHYQIVISPWECNSPAGLQALIIRADDCSGDRFQYVDCGNPYSEEEIRLFVDDSLLDQHYFIYIDGYDGARCTFQLSLKGFTQNPRTGADHRNTDLDYGNSPPAYYPEDPAVKFVNNEAEITWRAGSEEDVQLFLVERMVSTSHNGIGKVIGMAEPVTTVGSSQINSYRVVYSGDFEEKQKYCFRVVKISSTGEKSYSDNFCGEMTTVDGFYASPVFEGGENDIFVVALRADKRQELKLAVVSEEGDIVKQTVVKLPAGKGGNFEIDMNAFPAGNYSLRIEGRSGFYLRRFQVK
ncbi:MAG: hypothetical protein R3C61_09325 [Bacteroidia bacterium]